MTRNALIYACAVIGIGLAVLACATISWPAWPGGPFLVCLGLALLAATFKLRLPNLTGTLSPAFVFLLVAVATLSWSETVAIAAASGIMQCVWHPKTRPTALQVAFNAAAMAISAAVAHGMAWGMTADVTPDLPVILATAGVALLFSNTLLLSTILCLLKEAPFHSIWRSVQLWAVPYYLAGSVLAGVWARTTLTPHLTGIVLAAISVYVLSLCYRELALRVAPHLGIPTVQ